MTTLDISRRPRRSRSFGVAALICVAAIVVSACTNRPGAGVEVTVTESDNGDVVEIPESGIIIVELETNPSTGFRWELADIDPDAVEVLGRPRIEQPDTEAVGAPGVEVWRFKALYESDSTLGFEYVRPFERGADDDGAFEIDVEVHKGHAEIPPLHLPEEEHSGSGSEQGDHDAEDQDDSGGEDHGESDSGGDSHG